MFVENNFSIEILGTLAIFENFQQLCFQDTNTLKENLIF